MTPDAGDLAIDFKLRDSTGVEASSLVANAVRADLPRHW
jgi:hypothetical protein